MCIYNKKVHICVYMCVEVVLRYILTSHLTPKQKFLTPPLYTQIQTNRHSKECMRSDRKGVGVIYILMCRKWNVWKDGIFWIVGELYGVFDQRASHGSSFCSQYSKPMVWCLKFCTLAWCLHLWFLCGPLQDYCFWILRIIFSMSPLFFKLSPVTGMPTLISMSMNHSAG